jgi:hypothetical protein
VWKIIKQAGYQRFYMKCLLVSQTVNQSFQNFIGPSFFNYKAKMSLYWVNSIGESEQWTESYKGRFSLIGILRMSLYDLLIVSMTFKPNVMKFWNWLFLFLFQLILASVLNAFYDSICQILRRNVEKRALLENMDAGFLVMDEICDGG